MQQPGFTAASAAGKIRGIFDRKSAQFRAQTCALFWLCVVSMGAIGIWLGLVAGLSCAAVLLLRRFWWQRFWMQDMTTTGAAPARSA